MSSVATYTDESILKIVSRNDITSGYHTFIVNDENYSTEVIILYGDQILTSDPIWGDTIDDETMLIVIIYGNLIVDSNVIITPQARKRGFLLYVTEKIINNGIISMTARGANAIGQDVYLWKNSNNTYEFIPAIGASGGTTVINGNGNPGLNGINRQTGGGGSATAIRGSSSSGTPGRGGNGTSYSGGSGAGALRVDYGSGDSYPGSDIGGSGGDAAGYGYGSYSWSAGGGIGNENGLSVGSSGSTTVISPSGTGGLLIIFCRILENNNNIQSLGTDFTDNELWTGGSTIGRAGGGASGGGSINIFYIDIHEIGIISAAGGIGGIGMSGGDGSITLTQYQYPYYLLPEENYDKNIITLNTFLNEGKYQKDYSASPLVSSFLVASIYNHVTTQIILLDQKIINTNYITLDIGNVIYKMQITETLNDSILKYIFCVDDNWYWFTNNSWQKMDFEDFNTTNGNTKIEIDALTESNWLDFDNLFTFDNSDFFNRKIKICALLSHDIFGKAPIIEEIKISCYKPTEGLSVSTNKYTVINSFDKYEIIWNDGTKTTLQIIYQ